MAKHQLSELATGERVISERVPGVRSVALGFWIGAGSRDEPEARAGVSHFIEHLLFKGSSRYSAQEIAEIFDELGGELNAATSRETTVVYARIPDERLERALDVMADMVFRPTFVGHRLRARGRPRGDRDGRGHAERPRPRLRRGGGLRRAPARPACDRPCRRHLDVSRRALASYHRRAYQGEKIVLAAAGNVRHDELVSMLAERLDGRHPQDQAWRRESRHA